MDAHLRRAQILAAIGHDASPTSASALAKQLGVSRQIIVGDVALLRAQGHDILATARGYTLAQTRLHDANQYIGKVACLHCPEDTVSELYTMVDLGAVVQNVIITHELYGEITGQLNLRTRQDVDLFIQRVAAQEVKLLSELTAGVHLHTIACRDRAHFEAVNESLATAGFLYA